MKIHANCVNIQLEIFDSFRIGLHSYRDEPNGFTKQEGINMTSYLFRVWWFYIAVYIKKDVIESDMNDDFDW